MDHLNVAHFLFVLAVLLGTAKALGALARWIGQPAVLGELIAGVLLGISMADVVDAGNDTMRLLAEIGVVILLFEIGLETDLWKLLQVGGASATVAAVGVALPFVLGYLACRLLGLGNLVAVVGGATLTATSVGITARVLSDLGRLDEPEGQVILGAAVLDDIIGLVILSVVAGLAQGDDIGVASVAKITGVAFGFLAATLLLGRLVVPFLIRAAHRVNLPGTPTMFAVILAFSLASLAGAAGSAMIIGAFAAGLLVRDTPKADEVGRGVAYLGYFFVPIFFVSVGAAVDVTVFNPLEPENRQTLIMGSLLIAAAILGKFLAGYAAFWFKGNKRIIGVGMIPRGEVGLIFAQTGLSAGVFDHRLFGAATLMVLVTTFMAPPLLKLLCSPACPQSTRARSERVEELVNEP